MLLNIYLLCVCCTHFFYMIVHSYGFPWDIHDNTILKSGYCYYCWFVLVALFQILYSFHFVSFSFVHLLFSSLISFRFVSGSWIELNFFSFYIYLSHWIQFNSCLWLLFISFENDCMASLFTQPDGNFDAHWVHLIVIVCQSLACLFPTK